MAYLAGVYLLESGDAPVVVEIEYAEVATAKSYSFRFRPTRRLQLLEVVPGAYRVNSWTIDTPTSLKRSDTKGHAFSRVFSAFAGAVYFVGEYSLALSSLRDAGGVYYGGRVELERIDLRFHDREMMKGLFPNFAQLPFIEAYASR